MNNLTIWKYSLEIVTKQTISMPAQGRILTVQTQNDQSCIWALVDPTSLRIKKTIYIYETGEPIPSDFYNSIHIGTFQLDNELLVYHVFIKEY